MGARTGDVDPAIIGYLLEHTGMNIKELDRVLNKKSGLKGICGLNDIVRAKVWVVPTNEELQIAREVVQIMERA
jgi:acetate kinase